MANLKIAFFCIIFFIGCSTAQNQQDLTLDDHTNTKDDESSSASCYADQYVHFIGMVYEDVKSELPKHRWKQPGFMYTGEYISDRLNVETDESGAIIALKCG